jgi:DNA polymerase
MLAFAEENPDEVPSVVADVIQCTDDLWASSTAKFSRMSAIADEEDRRIRGAFVFAGGAATGRASSYGIQIHNLPRKALKNAEAARAALVRGHRIVPEFGVRTSDVLRGMLRPSLIPKPGHVFVVADFSAIEGRVNPWLAKSDAGEDKLDVFRAKKDPYIVNAAATFTTLTGTGGEDLLAAYAMSAKSVSAGIVISGRNGGKITAVTPSVGSVIGYTFL